LKINTNLYGIFYDGHFVMSPTSGRSTQKGGLIRTGALPL